MLTPTQSHANVLENWCENFFRPLSREAKETEEQVNFREIQNLEELLDGFRHGLELDPSDPSQRSAFDLYRGLKSLKNLRNIQNSSRNRLKTLNSKRKSELTLLHSN